MLFLELCSDVKIKSYFDVHSVHIMNCGIESQLVTTGCQKCMPRYKLFDTSFWIPRYKKIQEGLIPESSFRIHLSNIKSPIRL